MHRYAQTNVQLFNQLRSEGYSEEDRECIRKTYDLAMSIFTGLFLPSGKTFIDHLVGTASILATLHVPVEVIAAGLIHAAYLHGDFGDIRRGISETKRRQVREAVGSEIEEYVARYDRLLWRQEIIPLLGETVERLAPIDRLVLLIRLANELEHELDLGALYYANSDEKQRKHREYIQHYGPIMVETAEVLGYETLAAAMKKAFKKVTDLKLPIEPRIRTSQTNAYLVIPKSFRMRLRHGAYKNVKNGCQSISYAWTRARRVLGRCVRLARKPLRQAISRARRG